MNAETRRFLLLSVLCALAAGALMGLGLGGGFVLDDAQTIVNNPLIRVSHLDKESLLTAAASFQAGHGSRPLAMLSFALDYWRQDGLDASTFKTTNLLIHVLTTFALAWMLRKLLTLARWPERRAAAGALVIALAWGIHPLQVSTVLYVVQRMQTLSTFFVVLALWAYLALRQAQMAGRPARRWVLAAGACWLLGMLGKEDAILLPLYCLLLELTVLRFGAQPPWHSQNLRRTYLALAIAGAGIYLLWALPHYWSWQDYPGRDFNSVERLLTQGRVLTLYLTQMLLPLPSRMPFNYDTYPISHGLLQPPATLAALLVLAGLLVWAWRWRQRRPIFSFGIFLFFAGHAITSNVIALELVFEHRNQLPLLGILLALADLLQAASARWQVPGRRLAVGLALVLLATGSAGALRAWHWGEPVRFAEYSVRVAPDSPRAWLALAGTWFDRYKQSRSNTDLDRAIAISAAGAARTGSASAYANVVTYKSIRGTATAADWQHLFQRLGEIQPGPREKDILWNNIKNVRAGIPLDRDQVVHLIAVLGQRIDFSPIEDIQIGAFLYAHSGQPRLALPYFLRAAKALPHGDPNIGPVLGTLRASGHNDWARSVALANDAQGEGERIRP